MRVYFMRHSLAGAPRDDPREERERPLTDKGRDLAKAIAQQMGEVGEIPNVIFASPYQRAIDTADIVGAELGLEVAVIGDLAPVRPLAPGILQIIGDGKVKRPLFVGHHDNTTPLMNDDLEGADQWLPLVKGEVRRVKMRRKDGQWSLKWCLCPSDLGFRDELE
ncbi:MAG TPA: phosphoglycerate mutase family protein [Polyangiaceae bacterium]|jgi:phosphohistidine phosphatase SixA